jgi:hypothetical protein
MTRSDRALGYIDSQFSTMNKVKLATLLVGTKLGIPGAKKRLKRRVLNTSANIASEVGTKLIADKLGKDRKKSLAIVEGGRDILSSLGTPTLGKMLIK